jgi:hypothetical protein
MKLPQLKLRDKFVQKNLHSSLNNFLHKKMFDTLLTRNYIANQEYI